jgi:DNA-binding response OmpR family regulator
MKKVLYIDDEVVLVEMMKIRLRSKGYEIIYAYDGFEGIKLAEKENPDLILLDIIMPKMDGIEVCRKLKSNNKTAGIPVILFSAKDFRELTCIMDNCGADDCISKPFESKMLLEKMERLTSK